MAKKQKEESAVITAPQEQTPVNGNAPVEKQSERLGKGTSSKLFPENVKPEPAPKPEVQEPEPKKAEPIEASPAEPTAEEFYLEDLLQKQGIPLDKVKSRIKVDGKEETISFEEFKKRVQLKEHIDRASKELGLERREIMELKKRISQEQNFNPRGEFRPEVRREEEYLPQSTDPVVMRLMQRLDQIEQQTAGLTPVVYDVNRNRVAKELKAEGFDDFLEFIPEMETYLAGVKDPQLLDYYDSEMGAKALYLQLKNRKLSEQLKERAKESVKETKPEMERPRPPIVNIDSGAQPTTARGIDDTVTKYNQTLEKWKVTKDKKLFQELLQMRNALMME